MQEKPSFASKILLSLGLIIVSAAYAVWQNSGAGAGQSATPAQEFKAANDALLQTVSNAGSGTPAASAPPPSGTPAPQQTGLYADGAYTGGAADAYYGMVQVKAIVQGGKIVDVQFLQYPSDRSTSLEISRQAMPLLTQEAIQAQSANVNGVSGATDTSIAFGQSLASALALAKK